MRARGLVVLAVSVALVAAHGALGTRAAQPPPASDAAARWLPKPSTAPWQWQLQGRIDTSVPAGVYEVDGFDVRASVVRALHRKRRKVICYINAGAWEGFRSDADSFPASVLGRRYSGFPNERWLDIRQIDVLAPIMEKRLDMCAAKGFDAVEPDNVNGWEVPTGFPLTREDQLVYNRWIAREAHERGMSVALKNDGPQARDLVNDFDMAVVESCFRFDECGDYRVFIRRGKAVFATEYELEPRQFCAKARRFRFAAIRKSPALRARPWRHC